MHETTNNRQIYQNLVECMLGFLGSLPMCSKGPNEKTHFVLFKWRWVRLERDTQRETHLRGKNNYKSLREKEGEGKSVIFTYPLKSILHIATMNSFTIGSG